MSPVPGDLATYRTKPDLGPEPLTEADAITDLIRRTTALRRRLLVVTLAASILGGMGGGALYTATATRIYGPVGGAFFAAGAILTFALVGRLSDLVARAREAVWIADLARRHQLRPDVLTEALGMFLT
jgi:hypothetical protein